MRTDNTDELAQHVIAYAKALCNEHYHEQVTVFTEIGRLCNVELNQMSGLDPARNK